MLSIIYIALLLEAIEAGDTNKVNELLSMPEAEVEAASKDNSALRAAAKHGYLEIVNQLLKIPMVSSQANAVENDALRQAAYNGHIEVVNRLLEIDVVRAQAAIRYNNALVQAASRGHFEVVNRLLQIEGVGNKANAQANSALRWAANKGHCKIVYILLLQSNAAEGMGPEELARIKAKIKPEAFKFDTMPLSMLKVPLFRQNALSIIENRRAFIEKGVKHPFIKKYKELVRTLACCYNRMAANINIQRMKTRDPMDKFCTYSRENPKVSSVVYLLEALPEALYRVSIFEHYKYMAICLEDKRIIKYLHIEKSAVNRALNKDLGVEYQLPTKVVFPKKVVNQS